ncbi:hypothetical protein HDU83_006831 [Entophlyctis luteolus]|nr:hypothetical protein HDU83_006831 [Entophlyctis luteolus]
MAVDAPTDTLALALAHARNDERRAVAVGVYGTRVCYMQLIDLFVVACGGDGNLAVSHQVTHNPPDTVLRACGWTYHPDILWYEAGKAGHEGTTVYAVNVATGSTVCLSAEAPSGSTNRVVGVSPEYPAHVLVSCDAQVLYLSHVKTGHSAVQLAPETDVDSRFALTSFVADRALAAVVATKVNDKGDLEATLFNLGVSIAQNNRSSISFNPQRASIGAAPAATTAAVTGHESFGAKTRKSVKSLMSKTTLIRSRFSRNRQPSAAPAPMLPSTSEVPSPGDPDTPQGKRVVGVAASAAGTIHSFSQDSSSVLVSIHDPYAGHVLLSINFATLQTTEVLRTTDRITRVLASPSTGRLWACQTQSARSTRQHYTAIDSAVSSDFARLDQFARSFSSSADWVLHSISGDPDSRTWVISVETQSSRKYYLHKRGSARDPAFLFNAWPAMDTLMPGDSLSRTRRVGLLSRDARALNVFLTVPKISQASVKSRTTAFSSKPSTLIVDIWAAGHVAIKSLHEGFSNHGCAVVSILREDSVGSIDILDVINWCIANNVALQNQVVILGEIDAIVPLLPFGVFNFVLGVPSPSSLSVSAIEKSGVPCLLALGSATSPILQTQPNSSSGSVVYPNERGRGFTRAENLVSFVDDAGKALAKRFDS